MIAKLKVPLPNGYLGAPVIKSQYPFIVYFSGIRTEFKDKIFQPFFTTKPSGSGTGLGLSLSYDIVIAHGGELKVESQEGNGSEFFIHLLIVADKTEKT